MEEESVGLILFIAVVAIDVVALLVDLYLTSRGHVSITALARQYLAIRLGIIALQVVGTIGMAVHLWG